jgi:hypothetical protein
MPKKFITLSEKLGDFPWIGKPMDEGCSNGVRVLEGEEAVQAYLSGDVSGGRGDTCPWREKPLIQPGELFPAKEEVLIERYLQDRPGERWIEVTVGVITHTQGSEVRMRCFSRVRR